MIFTPPASQNPLGMDAIASSVPASPELRISQAPSPSLLLISFYFHNMFFTYQFVQHSFSFLKAKIDEEFILFPIFWVSLFPCFFVVISGPVFFQVPLVFEKLLWLC